MNERAKLLLLLFLSWVGCIQVYVPARIEIVGQNLTWLVELGADNVYCIEEFGDLDQLVFVETRVH